MEVNEPEICDVQTEEQVKFIHPKALEEKLTFPKQAFFLLGQRLLYMFSFFGVYVILAIYLKSELKFSESSSTTIYHVYAGFQQLCPIFGAILADQYLGKFKSILWMSTINILGLLIMALATIQYFTLPQKEIFIAGLFLYALGAGSLRPCITAFGGDQFILPEQEKQLSSFNTYFYIATNAGMLTTGFILPVLSNDVKCFGEDSCYSLAFGTATIIMLIAAIVLILGHTHYIKNNPVGSIMTQVIGIIWNGTKRKLCLEKQPEHWLDHEKERYPSQLVEDTKRLLKILVLFIPFPIYSALYMQQGSRWTYQATRMNGQIGNWEIKADQMQLLNPIFSLLLAPLFNLVVYPILTKLSILKKPLHRIVVGGVFNGISFFISGFLELYLADANRQGSEPLHMLWQIPQYLALVVGEIMFVVTSMDFFYTQAPESMKTTIKAAYAIAGSLGNVIIVIAAKVKLLEQANEFFLFGSLMCLDMVLLAWIAYNYTDNRTVSKGQDAK